MRLLSILSSSARVIEYQMMETDHPGFYAHITRVELNEISLTDMPSNPKAIVTQRYRVSGSNAFYQALTEKVAR
jgi:hypothetical protein